MERGRGGAGEGGRWCLGGSDEGLLLQKGKEREEAVSDELSSSPTREPSPDPFIINK